MSPRAKTVRVPVSLLWLAHAMAKDAQLCRHTRECPACLSRAGALAPMLEQALNPVAAKERK